MSRKYVLPGPSSPHLMAFEQMDFMSWEELRSFLFEERNTYGLNIVYRGHANADWRLKPTLERIMPLPRSPLYKAWDVGQEPQSIYFFKRASHHYLAQEYLPKPTAEDQEYLSDREWLAIMQHSGSQTRLLDVTISPFVAAFFALSDIHLQRDAACIWAFDVGEMANQNVAKLGIDLKPGEDPRRKLEPLNKALPYWNRPEAKVVAAYYPEKPTPRPYFQKGAFLYTLDNDHCFEKTLAGYDHIELHVRKLCLPVVRHVIVNALKDFRAMTISYSTLFPGLDGFAKDIALETYIGTS